MRGVLAKREGRTRNKYLPRLRLAVYLFLVCVGLILIMIGLRMQADPAWQSIFLNLGTEVGGSILLIFIVDYLFSLNSESDMMDRLEEVQRTVEILKVQTQIGSIFFSQHESITHKIEDVLLSEREHSADAFVYKGYPSPVAKEVKYYDAVIFAIKQGYIDTYHRVMAIKEKSDIDKSIESMKMLCRSRDLDLTSRYRFYMNYLQYGNYMTFVIIEDSDCFVIFPNLLDSIEVIGHQCGVYVNDAKAVRNLREVFKEITSQKYSRRVEIPYNLSTESSWNKFWDDKRVEFLHELDMFKNCLPHDTG
jgi:hypothetical protein